MQFWTDYIHCIWEQHEYTSNTCSVCCQSNALTKINIPGASLGNNEAREFQIACYLHENVANSIAPWFWTSRAYDFCEELQDYWNVSCFQHISLAACTRCIGQCIHAIHTYVAPFKMVSQYSGNISMKTIWMTLLESPYLWTRVLALDLWASYHWLNGSMQVSEEFGPAQVDFCLMY